MSDALAAAIRLHDFLRSNTGETADWPLQITSRDPGAVQRLDTLLREFRDAVTSPAAPVENECPGCGQHGKRKPRLSEWTCTNPRCDVLKFCSRT